MLRRLSVPCVAALMMLTGCSGPTSQTFEVPGESMEPTIRHGQKVKVKPVKSGAYKPKRGEIVVFAAPAEWRADAGDEKFLKRVIAIGGDTVACCDSAGKLTLNGAPLAEPYLHDDERPQAFGPVKVPDGRLWLMGDWRSRSGDSREHFARTQDVQVSTVPQDAVVAVVE